MHLKGTIFLKNRHFFYPRKIWQIDKYFLYDHKCGIWQPVKFQLVSGFWTGSKMYFFFFLSYLLINVGNINSEKQ